MSGSFDDFDREERALRHALHGKVDQMTGSPLATRDVHARATGIRRRRTAIAGAGIAAALAIIVPTALYAGGALDDDTTPPVTSGSPSPSQATDPSQSAEPSVPPVGTRGFETGDLGTGAAPAIDYAEVDLVDGVPDGGVIHTAEGRDIDLPAGQLRQFAALGDGWVVDVVDPDDGRELVYLLDTVGNYSEPWEAQGGLAVSADGSFVTWVGADRAVRVASVADVVELDTLPAGTTYSVAGVVGPDCTTAAQCTVLVNADGAKRRAFEVTADRVRPMDDYLRVTASHGTTTAGMTSVDDLEPSSCSDLFDVDSGAILWNTCDNTLGAFSPSGATVLGLPAYESGLGPTELDLLDAATGNPLLELTSSRKGTSATSVGEVWEDDSHLLTIAYDEGKFAIVRVGLDGGLEYAVEPAAGADTESPFRLPTR